MVEPAWRQPLQGAVELALGIVEAADDGLDGAGVGVEGNQLSRPGRHSPAASAEAGRVEALPVQPGREG